MAFSIAEKRAGARARMVRNDARLMNVRARVGKGQFLFTIHEVCITDVLVG